MKVRLLTSASLHLFSPNIPPPLIVNGSQKLNALVKLQIIVLGNNLVPAKGAKGTNDNFGKVRHL